MEFQGKIEKKIIKGKPVEADGKIIYPVAQISIQNDYNEDIIATEVVPIAIIVKEDNEHYIIPIIDELADMVDIIKIN